jgi:hypothetical protein
MFTPDAPAVFRCLGVPKLKRVDARSSMELLIAGIYHFNLKKIRWHVLRILQ